MGDRSAWDEIVDIYTKGNRYKLARDPNKDGSCPKGYRRGITGRVFDGTESPELQNYWWKKNTNLASKCLPDVGTADEGLEWFKREETRNLEFTSAYDDKNGKTILYDTDDWYAPSHCKGGFCPFDFLPNERQVNQEFAETYLETPLDCKHQGGRWVKNRDSLQYTVGGVCIFKKGEKPKFVDAARYENKNMCKAAGYNWDEKWLNNMSKWSSPCYYLPSKEDYDSYVGDLDYWRKAGIAAGLEHGINEAPTAAESLLEWLNWAAGFINEHKLLVATCVALYFIIPIVTDLKEIL